jgi:hypothetical protein
MTTGPPPRRRPHPARRARRMAGSLSVAALFALTGCIAATTKTTATRSTATAANATATSTTAATTVATDDDSVAASRSTSVAAVATTASTQSDTSSHAS